MGAGGLARRQGLFGCRQQTLTLHSFPGELAVTPHGFRLFPDALLGRLLVCTAGFHLAEDALTLQLLLQDPEGLIDIVVSNENLQTITFPTSTAWRKTKKAGDNPTFPGPFAQPAASTSVDRRGEWLLAALTGQ